MLQSWVETVVSSITTRNMQSATKRVNTRIIATLNMHRAPFPNVHRIAGSKWPDFRSRRDSLVHAFQSHTRKSIDGTEALLPSRLPSAATDLPVFRHSAIPTEKIGQIEPGALKVSRQWEGLPALANEIAPRELFGKPSDLGRDYPRRQVTSRTRCSAFTHEHIAFLEPILPLQPLHRHSLTHS